jgi:[Skp1-protein]-hydroxyproline N-acetylglucosaminyltransferase
MMMMRKERGGGGGGGFNLSKNILSFLGTTTSSTPTPNSTTKAKYVSPTDADVLARNENGHTVVKDGLMGETLCREALSEAEEIFKSGKMKTAGMGKRNKVDMSYRGDSILWLTSEDDVVAKTKALRRILSMLTDIRDEFVKCYGNKLSLSKRISIQLARYPANSSGYVRHTDVRQEDSKLGMSCRRITALYYLNPDWKPEHKGQLRVFKTSCNDNKKESSWDVDPVGDRLLMFRSDQTAHEVMSTGKQARFALTCWFYGCGGESNSLSSGSSLLPRVVSRMPRHMKASTTTKGPPPLPTIGKNDNDKDTIFVSIVSYRDTECQHTLLNMFNTASCPNRVFVGLVPQIDADHDAKCFRVCLPKRFEKNVRMIFVRSRDACGPCWARSLAQSLHRGEKYFLQIDSHMRFRPGWDRFLIEQLKQIPSSSSKKPILTTYPIGYEINNSSSCFYPEDSVRGTLLLPTKFDENGMLRQSARRMKTIPKKPVSSLLWASGFSFSSSDMLKECPYDSSLRSLFFGEEISMAARLWTSGWDFFAPTQTVVFHLWKRSHRPSFRETRTKHNNHMKSLDEKNSRERVLKLLTTTIDGDDNGRFGLGHVRKLCDFESRLGVSFTSQTIQSVQNFEKHECFHVDDETTITSSSSSSSLSSSDKIDILRKFIGLQNLSS